MTDVAVAPVAPVIVPVPPVVPPAPPVDAPITGDGGTNLQEGFFEKVVDEAGTIGKWIWQELVAAEQWIVDEVTGASKQGRPGDIKVTAPDGTVNYHPAASVAEVHPEIVAPKA